MRKKAFTREQRKRMVVHKFAEWIQKENREVWATSYQIAKALNMSPAPTFRKILNDMVDDGLLIARKCDNPGRWVTTYYALTPGTYAPPIPRRIAINPGKKNSTQLEMWS